MREIAQVATFNVRGKKVVEKVRSIVSSGEAKEILMLDKQGEVKFKVSTDYTFLNQTLVIVKGIVQVIKGCTLVVTNKQTALF